MVGEEVLGLVENVIYFLLLPLHQALSSSPSQGSGPRCVRWLRAQTKEAVPAPQHLRSQLKLLHEKGCEEIRDQTLPQTPHVTLGKSLDHVEPSWLNYNMGGTPYYHLRSFGTWLTNSSRQEPPLVR